MNKNKKTPAKKIVLRIFLIIVLFFIGLSLSISIYGKSVVEDALSNSLKRKVTIGSLSFDFPLGVHATSVSIKDFLQSKSLIVQLNPKSVFEQKFIISSIKFIKPIIWYKDILKETKESSKSQNESSPQDVIIKSQKQFSASIEDLYIKEGQFVYLKNVSGKDLYFKLDNIELEANDISLPLKSETSKFRVIAHLEESTNPLLKGRVEASGWINLLLRNMEGSLKVKEQNGVAELAANISSKNNDVTVEGNFKTGSSLKKDINENTSIEEVVLGALSSSGIGIDTKFSFKTKLDNFKISNLQFTGNVTSSKDLFAK